VKGADFSKGWAFERLVQRAVQYADYALALELMDLCGDMKTWRTLKPVVLMRLRVVCLGAVGRRDEAAALAEKAAGENGVAPLDAAKFRVSAALLRKQDVGDVIAEAKLPKADVPAAWRTAIRQALIWGDSDAAETCAAAYEKLFASFPKRALKVGWSDEAIGGVTDWRKIAPTLDRQYCDLKFRMSIDDLVTDVATGGRSPVEESALDSDDARMEVSSVCDAKGLHIFLRVEDPNARAVERGFAGGMAGEAYLAPGPDRPYVSFGIAPKDDCVEPYNFATGYECRGYSRPNMSRKPGGPVVRFETQFTDADYVEHLFFAWENYFTDLPTDGHPWRFECISWTPKGAYTWAGSQGPHESSSWGDLVFSLTPAQVTAIRRTLLCSTRSVWRKTGRLDVFEKWADPESGDPAFYAECLKPLEAKLAAAMDGVKPDMTDADVNRIFEMALVQCRGLKHEIDALRKAWLRRRLTD